MLDRAAAGGVPAGQHMLDPRIGGARPVAVVADVHGDDIGHDGGTNVVVVVGDDLHALWAFDQERSVADESDPHGPLLALRELEGRGLDQRAGWSIGHADALLGGRACHAETQDKGGGDP